MANTKSIQKVLTYLEKKQEAVSPTEISLAVHLKNKTIKEVLEILKLTDQIIFLTTGKRTLIKFKGEENAKPKLF